MGISHCINHRLSYVNLPTCNLYLNLFNVSPLKHGNPVSSINATKATISSWYGLKTKTNILTKILLRLLSTAGVYESGTYRILNHENFLTCSTKDVLF